MIDYKAIIDGLEDNRVKNLLEELGADVIEKDEYFMISTICHNANAEEASHKLYYYKNSHMFYCYTECGAQNIFKFLKNYYETRGIEYDWYTDIYQTILNCSLNKEVKNKNRYKSIKEDYVLKKDRKELPVYSVGLLDCFTNYYPIEWLNDSITKETMDKFNIKYSISQNKIIIPHFDVYNRLIGIRGRALNKQEVENLGKYMPVQIEGKWYSHPLSLNLYGLNINKDNIKRYKVCYIFESEKSVMQADSWNIPNCAVASCGSNINKFQIDLLMRYCAPTEIVICFDNEEVKGEQKYFQKLWNICNKYKNYCNMSFIYDRKGITKLKDSPSDNGEEVFLQLLKERVKIK